MKYLTLALLALTLAPAFAADVPPTPQPKPPTVEELQKQVDFLTVALQGAQQQRDAAQKQLNDLQLQDYATKVAADKTAQAESEKKAKK